MVHVDDGRVGRAEVAVAGVGGRATWLPETSARLAGESLTGRAVAEVGASAAHEIRPRKGGELPAGYVRAAIGALVEDAVTQALGEVEPLWRWS